MLAEWSVSRFETASATDLSIELVDAISESILIKVNQDGSNSSWVKLLEAERVHDNLARDLGSGLHLQINF